MAAKTKCAGCKRNIFGLDKVNVGAEEYHKDCLKCNTCGMKLNVNNFIIHENTVYCSKHAPVSKLSEVPKRPSNQINSEALQEILSFREHAPVSERCSKHKEEFRQCDACSANSVSCRECAKCVQQVCTNALCLRCGKIMSCIATLKKLVEQNPSITIQPVDSCSLSCERGY